MDAVELTIEGRSRPVGSGRVRRLLPWRHRRMVGPFIFVDLIGPDDLVPGAGVDVDAHPHIGLSTLTYLFAGSLVHRDSVGSVRTVDAGDVNWMTAGSGVVHTERSAPGARHTPRRLHGLQTWVALPAGAEDVAARFEHVPRSSLPQGSLGGATVRIAAGTAWGEEAPVGVSSPLVLAEIHLDGSRPLALDATHPERGVLALDDGVLLDGRPLVPGSLAVLRTGATPLLSGTGRCVLLGGEPVGHRHIWWNFVHSDPDRIEDAKAAWAEQRFPRVPDDHDPWVRLPD